MLALLTRSTTANPSEDLIARVDDEYILGVELVASGSSALTNLGHLKSAGSVAETEEDTASCLTLELEIITTLGSSGIRTSTEAFRPLLGILLSLRELVKDNDLRDAATLVVESTTDLSGLVALKGTGLLAVELDEKETEIKDEHITAVDGLRIEGDLHKADVLAALDLEQTGLVLLGLDLVEAGVDTTTHDTDATREVALEELRLEALNLTMLDWATAKILVELDGLVGGSAHLILRGLLAEPEVNIPLKSLPSRAIVGVHNNVRVAREEGSIAALGLRNNLKLLNTPDLKTSF